MVDLDKIGSGLELPPRQHLKALEISLKEVVALALENNYDIVIGRYSPEISKLGITNEEAVFDPTAEAAVGSQRTTTENVAQVRTTEELRSGGAEIKKKFTTGTQVGLGYQTKDNRDPASDGQYNTTLKLTLTQSLLKNFGIDINTARIQLAHKNLAQSTLDFSKQIVDTVADVQNAYWELYKSIETLEVRRKSYELNRRLLEQKKTEVQLGATAASELTELVSTVADNVTDYQEAVKTLEENDINLRSLLNLPFNFEGTPVQIRLVQSPDFALQDFDRAQIVQAALEAHPEYMKLKSQIEAKEIELRVNRNQLWPELEASASYGLDKFATGWRGSQNLDTGGDNYELQLKLSYPLGNRDAKSNLKKSELELKQLNKRLAKQALDIKKDISNALIALKQSGAVVTSSRNNVHYKLQNLQVNEKKLKFGTSNMRDYLQIQTELIEAQLKLIESKADYEKALVEIYKARGIVNPQLQVELPEMQPQTSSE